MISPTSTVWTERNCALLTEWWTVEGLTSYEIANRFRGLGYIFTRNAIIGRVHRMKLVAPESKNKAISEKRSKRATISNLKKANKVKYVFVGGKKFNPLRERSAASPLRQNGKAATVISPTIGDKAILLKHSKAGQCKAILGYVDGKLEDAVYCGEKVAHPVIRGGERITYSWCDYHKSIYLTGAKR